VIRFEIKRKLNSGHVCYHSVYKMLSLGLLSKNVPIRMYKTVIFSFGSVWVQDMVSDIQRGTGCLGRMFVLKRDEVIGGWGRLNNVELHNLYSLPNIIRVMKSKRMRWVQNVARIVVNKNVYTFLL
jgi:hypothetical protein